MTVDSAFSRLGTPGLTERDWQTLLGRIGKGKCTPFIGAGACYGTLPMAKEIALKWSKVHHYPMGDCDDLAKVAQFMAVRQDPMFPKEEMIDLLDVDNIKLPDFSREDEPHGVLARLPLSLYLTTNYDNIMLRALGTQPAKGPCRCLCRWNAMLRSGYGSGTDEECIIPDKNNPVIFHLHGHHEVPESLVLTHDDYVDFLVNTWRSDPNDNWLLPPYVQRAITSTSLLFIGYSLQDLNFRVLYRGLIRQMEKVLRRVSVTVQLPLPGDIDEIYLKNGDRVTGKLIQQDDRRLEVETEAFGEVSIEKDFVANVISIKERREAMTYLEDYFGEMDLKVFWGTAAEFAREISSRWREAHDGE